MSGYGEPDWINPQTDTTTTVENDVGGPTTAPAPGSRYVTRMAVTIESMRARHLREALTCLFSHGRHHSC